MRSSLLDGLAVVAPAVRIIGNGRAGGSFAGALEAVGWDIAEVLGRDHNPSHTAVGVDLVLICTPDAEVAHTAQRISPADAVVAHVAGSLGLSVLAPHLKRAAIHPLISLPDAAIGNERLQNNGWFGIAGDPIAAQLVAALGGQAFEVDDADRAVYHAAACVAANHVVALMGQVERLASTINVPSAAYLDLTAAAIQNVVALGAEAALTGPAARGDDDTIALHVDNLPADERGIYQAMANEARRLAGRDLQ